mmetsp:Transcript_24035/g.43538  ORF Transcript_24035/g.43538 Transcript_24035/m.43538 type:complete len:232 (+) Transcript_24035:1182-1877(+)
MTVLVLIPQTPHPKPKRESHCSHSHGLIIVPSSHAPHKMRRHHTHKSHREQGTLQGRGTQPKQPRTSIPRHRLGIRIPSPHGIQRHSKNGPPRIHGQTRLVGNASYQKGGNDSEPCGNVTAYIVEGHGISEDVSFEEDGGELHSGEDGGADGTAEGVPYLVIEPGEELFGSVFVEVLSRPPIEIRIEFVNHRTELLNRLETNRIRIGKENAGAVQDRANPYEADEIIGRSR